MKQHLEWELQQVHLEKNILQVYGFQINYFQM